MEKAEILGILKAAESEFPSLPYFNMSELVDYYQMLEEKYSLRVSEYVIVRSEIFKETSIDGEVTTTSFSAKNKIVGIDYEFLDFRFNDELAIENIEIDNLDYKGRSDFNRYSYFTTNILIEKMQSMISRNFTDDKVLAVFNLIKDKCFPSMGGYAAIETCYFIGSTYASNGKIEESLMFYNLMSEHRQDIADSTIGSFYKAAAELYINLNLNNEALKMINKGLELYPKLSVKKMKKLLE